MYEKELKVEDNCIDILHIYFNLGIFSLNISRVFNIFYFETVLILIKMDIFFDYIITRQQSP